MTLKSKALAAVTVVRSGVSALVKNALGYLADAIGWLGLLLAGRGIWLQFGESWALIVVGGWLIFLSFWAARGSR